MSTQHETISDNTTPNNANKGVIASLNKRTKQLLIIVVAVVLIVGATLGYLFASGAIGQIKYNETEFTEKVSQYKKATINFSAKLLIGKYEATDSVVKSSEEYKTLSEALTYFSKADVNSAPKENQESVKILKENAKAMQAYYDSIAKAYTDAGGDKVKFTQEYTKILKDENNVKLTKTFYTELAKFQAKQ